MSKATEATKIWVVTTTEFTDDYKPRGDDWSSASEPVMFTTEKAASNYKYGLMLDYIYEHEYDKPKGDASLWHQTKDGEWRLNDWTTVDDVIDYYTQGEFVARRISWDISSSEVRTSCDTPENDEEEDDEDASEPEEQEEPPTRKRAADDLATEDEQVSNKSKRA